MPLKRIFQRASEERRKRDAEIIAAVEKEFPPKYKGKRPAAPGLPAAIRAAREKQGLTWYALAQKAGVPNQGTIRDIEEGKDVKVSSLQAVVHALGMELELVPAG
jgi:DNA-binding XRE family transcriptional regulator